MRKVIFILLFALIAAVPADAQRRKKTPQLTPEQQEHLELMARMKSATQRIMFIDSVVVDKKTFLSVYNLNPECGRIVSYLDYFKDRRQPNGFVFIPEIEKQCYFSKENNEGIINLYISERIANKWTRPTRLRGINDDRRFTRVNYPFMMGDGSTLYFSADGQGGAGGYDIYVTRYDEESHRFLKPENIGMPFNSEGNDYMYVIDEYDSLGWFATDRNQPEDKVCVYTFVPPIVREIYDAERYTPEQIDSFAVISRIADTWSDPTELRGALQRLRYASVRKRQAVTGRELMFVVNDSITYTRYADFKAEGNAKRYRELMALRDKYHSLNATLERVRNYYSTTAKGDERQELRDEILESEEKSIQMLESIRRMTKDIRNAEIIFLQHGKKTLP